jgi:hypothetical protein
MGLAGRDIAFGCARGASEKFLGSDNTLWRPPFKLQIDSMTASSTHQLLVLHLFNELPPAERNGFEHLLISDADLQQDYADFSDLLPVLEGAELAPDSTRLQALLDYAASV